ncbi:MAG: hypothetical protein JWN45_2931 [Acidobacteriaceae bacterium]|nr:hypothetical protein [Acidobacteriaceae bacterium]
MPAIRGMLDDPAFASFRAELVKQFIRAGGETVADELVSRLADKLKFWQTTAPMLRRGWWNDVSYPVTQSMREQYVETLELVRSLNELTYANALGIVRALRDFWRATPQLDDPSGLNQMAEESDRLIAKLQAHESKQ